MCYCIIRNRKQAHKQEGKEMTREYVAIFKDDTLAIFTARDLHDAWKKALEKWGRMVHSVDIW
jgi:hypothetical protein